MKRTCELCDREGIDVRASRACYADDGRFERIERCIDHQECRGRVEDSGGVWPLVDITNPRWRLSGLSAGHNEEVLR